MRVANKPWLVLIGLAAAPPPAARRPRNRISAVQECAATTTTSKPFLPTRASRTPTDELTNGDDEASNVNEPANSDNAQH